MPRLGKREYRHDERTLPMALVMAVPPKIPLRYDIDKGRAAFPMSPFGNNDWGNCVIVSRANHALRMERVEHRTTLGLTTEDVVEEYKQESARQFGDGGPSTPGDPRDRGLYMLEAMRDWRKDAWEVKFNNRAKVKKKQSIAAFGSLNAKDAEELRAAIYGLSGVQLGLWLPNTAAGQWARQQAWDDVGTSDPNSQPGSWGGHAVFCKRYDEGGIYCITWGREVYMTNAFINRYCDEAWACVNDLSGGRYIDLPTLQKYLSDIGAFMIQ